MSKHGLIPVTGFTLFTNTQPQIQTEERGRGEEDLHENVHNTHLSLIAESEMKLTLHKYVQTSQHLQREQHLVTSKRQ
jgi:hypothetical protein